MLGSLAGRARAVFPSGSSPRSMGASKDAAVCESPGASAAWPRPGSRPFPAGPSRRSCPPSPRLPPPAHPSRSIVSGALPPRRPAAPLIGSAPAPPRRRARPSSPDPWLVARRPELEVRGKATQRPGLFGFLSDFGHFVCRLFWVL